MLQNKEKSDTRRYHSPCQTSRSARVALQRCPILCVSKATTIIPRISLPDFKQSHVVQSQGSTSPHRLC